MQMPSRLAIPLDAQPTPKHLCAGCIFPCQERSRNYELQIVWYLPQSQPKRQTPAQQIRVMKCPVCNAWTRTLETRTNEDTNEVWRRKECANLHIFVTTEQVAAGTTPRPANKSVVAIRSGRSKGAELDAPVNRRKKTENN